MNKKFLVAAGACAFLCTSCTSLPENARKLDINIESVSFTNINNVEGFNVVYTVHHNSNAPMPLENVTITVDINGKPAGIYTDNEPHELPNRITNHYSVFVPANRTCEVAKESLKLNPMLQVSSSATVSLIVEDDTDDSASAFNVEQTKKGIIHAQAD